MEGSLARALYTFQATHSDELSVQEGETIKVLHYINNHWLEAEYHGQRGLFPVSYAKWLDDESPIGNFVSLSSSDYELLRNSWKHNAAEFSSYSDAKHSTIEDSGGLFVEAAVGFDARNGSELTFPPGALIELIREVDDDWLEGSFNGRTGLFPKCYIKDSFQRPCARAVYPFVGESRGELTFREGERIFLRKRLNSQWMEGELDGKIGLFPSSFVAVEVDLPPDGSNAIFGSVPKHTNRNNVVSSRIQWKEGMKARALFHFTALYRGDLELNEGDIVRVLVVNDDNWIKGQLENGISGSCPAAYLEPINDNTRVPMFDNSQTVPPYASTPAGKTDPKLANGSSGLSGRTLDFAANANFVDFQSNDRCSGSDFVDAWHRRSLLESSLTEDLTPILTPSNIVKPFIKSKPSVKPKTVEKNSVTYIGGENRNAETSQTPAHTSVSMPLLLSGATVTAARSSLATSKGSSVRRDPSQLGVGEPYLGRSSKSLSSNSDSVGSFPGKRGGISKEAATLERNTSICGQKTRSPVDANDLLSGTLTSLPSPLIPLPHGGMESQDGHSDSSEGGSPIAPRRPAPPPPRRNIVGVDHAHSSNLAAPRPRILVQHVSYGEDRSLSTRGNKQQADEIVLNTAVGEPLLRTHATSLPYNTRGSLGSPKLEGRTNAKPKTLPRPTSKEWQEGAKGCSNPRRCSSLEQLSTITTSDSELPIANSTVLSHSELSLNADNTEDLVETSGVPGLSKLEERIAEAEQNLKVEKKVFSGMKMISQFVMTDPVKQQEMDAKVLRSQQKINEWQEELKQLKGERAFLIESHRKKILKDKIAELEADMEKQVRSQENLETLLGVVGENRKEEVMENLATCARLVEEIKMKLTDLESSLCRLTEKPAASTQKHMAEQRERVVSELINTEKDYCNDLELCVKYFLVKLRDSKIKDLDCEGLFGNIENVLDVSRKLLTSLEEACKDKDSKDQELGKCFMDLADEMKEVYAVYCRNHDDAIALMEKYEEMPEVQDVFTKCLDKIREHTRCWDLSSFLIKPVQRVLKYPLLLNELLKYTPEIQRDKYNLLQAISMMTDVANAINEFKRRKDLVVKYKKLEDSGLTTMIQKLNWHSVVKKSSRFNQRLTQLTGLVSQTVDEEFNEEEKKFRVMEKTVKTLWKNIVTYLEELQEATACQQMSAENISDYYQEAATCTEVSIYQRVQNMVRETVLNRFVDCVQRQVLLPLTSLLNLFQGPQRLIQKRHDKCLDYDRWSNKFDKIKDRDKLKAVKDELELAKKNYEALNTQLLEEIPGFTNKCMALVVNCLENFALAQSTLYDQTQQAYKQLLELSVVQTRDADVVEHHNKRSSQVMERFSDLSFIPSSFVGKDSSRKKRRSPRHPAPPSDDPNTPEGNNNNSSKSNLTEMRDDDEPARLSNKSLAPGPPLKQLPDGSLRPRPAPRRLATSTILETGHSENPQRVEVAPDEGQIHVVDFDFEAENVGELSVAEGDRVTVLRHCDRRGNPEWWLVHCNGSTGYVPQSFLSSVDEQDEADTANDHGEDEERGEGGGDGGDGASPSGETDANAVCYYADFVFEANSAAEVSLDEGQVVTVLQKHDLLGNEEWWLVEAGGKKGYAPASYLTPVQQ